MRRLCLSILLISAGLFSGYLVGRDFGGAAPEVKISRAPQIEDQRIPAPKTKTSIEQITEIEDEQQRLDQLLELVANLDVEDFPALFDTFAEHRKNKTAFREDANWCTLLALDRWCSLDPHGPSRYFRAMFTKDFKSSETISI